MASGAAMTAGTTGADTNPGTNEQLMSPARATRAGLIGDGGARCSLPVDRNPAGPEIREVGRSHRPSRIVQQRLQREFGGADKHRRPEFGRAKLDPSGLVQE